MKLWVPALLLLACFATATLWQARWTEGLREQRDRAWEGAVGGAADAPARDPVAVPGPEDETAQGGSRAPAWSRVVVGRPSGADPVPRPAGGRLRRRTSMPVDEAVAAGMAEGSPGDEGGVPASEEVARPELEFTMKVRRGQSLSVICQEHYKTARRDLVEALARFNALSSPDRIREGQTLRLPARQLLLN
jgi:nucleoid-associated protein YgaU